MSRRTTTVLAIIAAILIAVFAITRWQRSVATRKLLTDLPGGDYAKVMDAMSQLEERGRGIVPELLTLLGSGSAPARWRAAILLGEVGTRAAHEPLTSALSDKSPDVRAAAALALGKLRARAAAPQLVARLGDEDEDLAVRIAATRGLGLLKASDSRKALEDALSDRLIGFEALADAACTALATAQTGLQGAQEAVAGPITLTPPAAGDPPLTPEETRTALADKREELSTAVDTAREALADAGEAFTEANEDLEKVGGKALEAPIPSPPAPEGEAAAEDAEEAEPVEDTNWQLRKTCATALGMIGAGESLATLADSTNAEKEANAEVRTAAATALGDLAHRVHEASAMAQLTDSLLAALEDEIGDVRAAAIVSLGFVLVPSHDEARVEDTLQRSLHDDFYWAREAARKTMKSLNMAVRE